MNIVVFEDSPADLIRLTNIIARQCAQPPALASANAADILQYARSSQGATLYFIDLVAGGKPIGLDIARAILRKDNDDLIVFITSHSRMVLGQTYLQVKSFNLIDKQSHNVDKQIELTLALAQKQADRECFVIRKQHESIYIPFHSIFFIESIKRSEKIRIHSTMGAFEVNQRLHVCKQALDDRFIYLRRTHIVNRQKIQRIDYKNQLIFFTEDLYCPFSFYYARKNGYTS